MLISGQTTTLLQIFCELLLYSQVIFKSMKVADDTSKSNSECEWVNASCLPPLQVCLEQPYFLEKYFLEIIIKFTNISRTFVS